MQAEEFGAHCHDEISAVARRLCMEGDGILEDNVAVLSIVNAYLLFVATFALARSGVPRDEFTKMTAGMFDKIKQGLETATNKH